MRLALPLVLASQLTAPSAVPAMKTGTLTGRVHPPPDNRAIAKTLWIGEVSTPVAPDGRFRMTAAPAGPTQILVETSEGLYSVATPVNVAPGTTSVLQLALVAREDSSAPPAADEAKSKKRSGLWSNPASATLIIIGGAIVVGVALDQLVMSDDEASAFVPSSQTQH